MRSCVTHLRLLVVLLLLSCWISACEVSNNVSEIQTDAHDTNEARGPNEVHSPNDALDSDNAYDTDAQPHAEKTFSKQVQLQHKQTAIATVSYDPGLKLAIDEDEIVISEDLFQSIDMNSPPTIDIDVIEQEDRTNRIILVSVKTPDPTFDTRLRLWAFEYHDYGRPIRQIWELEQETVEVSYRITHSDGYDIQWDHAYFSEPLPIDEKTFKELEASGQHIGQLKLSPPMDLLLDDVAWGNPEDIIIRRKVIGDKPEWLPFDDVMTIYLSRRGQTTPYARYSSNESTFYSRNDLHPTYTTLYLDTYKDEPLVIIESNSKFDRTSVEKAIASSLTSNYPQRTSFQYDLHWGNDDQKVTVQFHDIEVVEYVYFTLDNVKNWLGRAVQPSGSVSNYVTFTKIEQHQPFINVIDAQTKEELYFEVPEATQIYIADDEHDSSKKIFMTNMLGAQLMDSYTGEKRTIPLNMEGEHKSSRIHFYYPDRFFTSVHFVIKSLNELYRYDSEGNQTLIWETPSEQPVYGFSISPSGKRIAVLYSADEWTGSSSDLIILDADGNEIALLEQAGFYSKSDGVIPKIELRWTDEHTVRLPTELTTEDGRWVNGTKVITLKEDGPAITEIEQPRDDRFDFAIYPSPNGEQFVEVSNAGIWLVSAKIEQEKTFLGRGHFLGWLDDSRVAWYESFDERSPEANSIF